MDNYYKHIFLHELSLLNSNPNNYIEVKIIAKSLIMHSNNSKPYFYLLIKDINNSIVAKCYQCNEHYNDIQFEHYWNTNFVVGEFYKISIFLVVKPKTQLQNNQIDYIELLFDSIQVKHQ